MKKNNFFVALLATTIGFTSCNSNQTQENSQSEETSMEEVSQSEEVEVKEEVALQGLTVEAIDQIRADIEALEIEPVVVSSEMLREKTKQKWSKVHFYVQNGTVVKVKTYPYAEVSKRTEEFYASENGLVLVVIEDNGEGPKGKLKSDIDKMYYFDNNTLIEETGKKSESEYSVREGDAEELIAEFNEYLDVFSKQ